MCNEGFDGHWILSMRTHVYTTTHHDTTRYSLYLENTYLFIAVKLLRVNESDLAKQSYGITN